MALGRSSARAGLVVSLALAISGTACGGASPTPAVYESSPSTSTEGTPPKDPVVSSTNSVELAPLDLSVAKPEKLAESVDVESDAFGETPKRGPAAKPSPSPSPSPPPPSLNPAGGAKEQGAVASGQSGFDASNAQRTVHEALPELRRCYDQARERREDTPAQALLSFTVDETGKVSQADVAEVTSELRTCLVQVVRALQFPPGDAATRVTTPLKFRAEGG